LNNSNLICDKIHDEVKLHFKIARSIDVGLESGTASLIENLKVYSKQLEINCYLQGLYIYRRYNACNILIILILFVIKFMMKSNFILKFQDL
jgi:hypothetical protein